MSVWIECVEKDYYQCNSCGTTDTLTKVRYGQIEEATSSFRMCDECLSLIPNKEIDELKKQNEIMKEALEFYANVDNWYYTDSYNITGAVIDDSDEESLGIRYKNVSGGKRARQALEKIK